MNSVADFISRFGLALLELSLETAPWLLVGLLLAGLIRALVPTDWMDRWLGKPGLGSITRAALIGTPLPLCSCSVLPVAVSLRQRGASRGATASFLIATPENGADSIAVSWALLGPFFTVLRPLAAVFSAILAGVLTELWPDKPSALLTNQDGERACGEASCACGRAAATLAQAPPLTPAARLREGMRFAVLDVLDDMSLQLLIGLLLAAIVATAVPHDMLQRWATGPLAMLAMLAIGLPMYICATASTPVAAAMLLAGVSPGVVLVFLLAGPATNFATMLIVHQQLGVRGLLTYLVGISAGALAFGFLTDWIVARWSLDIAAQTAQSEFVPPWIAVAALVALLAFAVRPLRRILLRPFAAR